MIGTIVKLLVLVAVVLIALNIFAPQEADKALSTISETTKIDKSSLKENLDKASEFTKDKVNEATEAVQDKLNN
jgi:hypothetical protein